jgi:multiple sugar transport system permease protein
MAAITVTPIRTETDRSAPPLRQPSGFATRMRANLSGWAFLIGGVICFAVFSWYPMVRGVIMSFQRLHRGETTWVGWANYERVWHDPSFSVAWRNTLLFTGLALVLGFAVPFFLAILLNELRHAQGFLRVLVYVPVMLPPASALLLFKFLYWPGEGGIINYILHTLHLPMSQFSQAPSVLTTQLSLVIASTWMNMGSATLIYLAALQNIPGELYEAAELDGAGIWRRIRTVTIPQIRLIISLMLLLQIVATMQVYVEPVILAGGAGSEDSATGLVYLIYQHAFNFNDLNGAAAIGVMMLIVLGVFSGLYAWLSRDRD